MSRGQVTAITGRHASKCDTSYAAGVTCTRHSLVGGIAAMNKDTLPNKKMIQVPQRQLSFKD